MDRRRHLGWQAIRCLEAFPAEQGSGVGDITALHDPEKRQLHQIMGHAYGHIFACVEEFMIPMVTQEALKDAYGDEVRLRALLRFAEEELKHQELFRRAMALCAHGFRTTCGVIPGREAVAKVVLSKSRLAVLDVTTLIEWLTQLHDLEHVRDASVLDELFRALLRCHWLEEAHHAKLDTWFSAELAEQATIEAREAAIDALLELGVAIDGWLSQQIGLNIEPMERVTGRRFTDAEHEEITTKTQRAWRWTFLVSGLEHPNFVTLVKELTTAGPGKSKAAAEALSA